MEQEPVFHDKRFSPPSSFFETIIADIPTATWVSLLQQNPTLKDIVLEGFSARPHKMKSLLRQSHVLRRLQRILQSEEAFLEEILLVWGQEQLATVAFLEMLDRGFLLENWVSLKDLIGPERFFAALYLLGYVEEEEIRERIGEDFWQRFIEPQVVDPLVPILALWKEFIQRFPQARGWVDGLLPSGSPEESSSVDFESLDRGSAEPSRHENQRRRKLEQKLEKTKEEQEHLQEEVARYRRENEEFRKKAAELEKTFESRLEEALAKQRSAWHRRYLALDEHSLEDARKDLDSVLKRADRAFELQRQADEQYGLIAVIRQRLLKLELYLKEIERVYGESLVVHPEVSRAKEALLSERKRILQLPGIEKVLRKEPELILQEDFRQKIRLLDAIPENLHKITRAQELVSRLVDLGFIDDPQTLQEDLEHKKHQVAEALYARFHPPSEQASPGRALRSFEDFVQTGESKKYDIYADGYNILLKAQGQRITTSAASLTAMREEFIDAVCGKSSLFRRVILVFDGVEDFRDRRGNAEIIYTDKSRGITADTVIIESLKRRKDRYALLVTADREIIKATESRVYALVDPYHFYVFVLGLR